MAAVKYRRSGSLLQPNLAQPKAISRPWIASEAVMLGALDVIIVGMSYLLSVEITPHIPNKVADLVLAC